MISRVSAAVGLAALLGLPTSIVQAQAVPLLTDQTSGTASLLQAVSPVTARVVWVSGHRATFAVTTDGGATWRSGVVPGDSTLQFRDVHAVDQNTAYLLSSGTGKASRIYRTDDGGGTWTLQHTNPDSAGFYDCMDFWDRDHGLVYGDEVDGQAVVLATLDGGRRWARLPPEMLPVVRKGEGGFAASGTCLVAHNPAYAWIGTGAGLAARIFRTANRGATWSVVETPVFHSAPASGIASLAFRDSLNGFAAGGNIGDPESRTDNVAVTTDGGRTWRLGGRPSMSGAIYGSAYAPGAPTPTLVIVSPKGAEFSTDNATTWTSLDARPYWSVAFAANGTGWMVGPGGRITRISVEP